MIAHENMERQFYSEVRERKSLVPSARHKKNGSKSKFVSLPSDGLTEGKWKKMNGETQSYKMKEPMTWKQFKNLPVDLMTQYLEFLRDEYNATGTRIAEEMGITYSTLYKFMHENGTFGVFHRGAKQPRADSQRMHLFFHPEDAVEEVKEEKSVEKAPVEPVKKVEKEVEPVEQTSTPPLFKSNMSKFTMEFAGEYDEKSLMNTMRLMVGQGTSCKIKITVEKEDCEYGS